MDYFQCDVIVNTTGKELDLSAGAVSKSLLTMAGQEMQWEARQNHPRGISHSAVAITRGHRLKCKHVFHGALKDFASDKNMEVISQFDNTL